jgi:hypothetical protein
MAGQIKKTIIPFVAATLAMAAVALVLPSQCWAGFKNSYSESRDCGSEGDVNYCFWKGDEGTLEVVVYLHGVGRTQTDWDEDKVTREINEQWQKTETLRPHVIGLSYGRFWWFQDSEYGNELTKTLCELKTNLPFSQNRELCWVIRWAGTIACAGPPMSQRFLTSWW